MKEKKLLLNHSWLYWLIFSAGLVLLIIIQYYGLIHFKYVVPPGDDPANHLRSAEPFFLRTGSVWSIWKSGGYPPGYHLFIAKSALLFHTNPLSVMLWTYPLILVLSSLAIFLLGYVAFGSRIGLLAFFLYGFTTRTPLQLLNDGGYPNLIAAHIFLPLTLACLILFLRTNGTKKAILLLLTILFTGLVVFVHHISTFYLLGILILSFPTYVIIRGVRKEMRFSRAAVALVLYVIFLSLIFWLYKYSSLLAPARELASTMIQLTNYFPFFKIVGQSESGAMYSLRNYPGSIGKLVVVFGAFGLFYLPYRLKTKIKIYLLPIILLISWVIFLFVGSRLTFLSNPERMARDLAVPFSILSSAALVYLWKDLLKYSKIALIVFAIIVFFLAYGSTKDRVVNAFKYEPMIRYTQADSEITQYLNSKTGRTMTLVYGYDFYFPQFVSKDNLMSNAYTTLTDSERFDPEIQYQFDYIYIVDSEMGWTPIKIKYGLASSFFQNKKYKFIMQAESPINHVYLFQVIK